MFTHHAKTHAEHNRIMLLLVAAMAVAAALAVAVQSKAIADATAGYRASIMTIGLTK